jgi:hypothetical protein
MEDGRETGKHDESGVLLHLAESFPDTPIHCFALLRTVSQGDIESVLVPSRVGSPLVKVTCIATPKAWTSRLGPITRACAIMTGRLYSSGHPPCPDPILLPAPSIQRGFTRCVR